MTLFKGHSMLCPYKKNTDIAPLPLSMEVGRAAVIMA